jgi:hypothetical protein
MTKGQRREWEEGLDRRGFIQLCTLAGSGLVVYGASGTPAGDADLVLKPASLLGKIKEDGRDAPIERATWYRAEDEGAGLQYRFEPGALASARYLTADALLDGSFQTVFHLILQEGEDGPAFRLGFALINQCSARIRMPLSAVDQNRWMFEREGAWLKPLAGGDRVNLDRVDRMILRVLRSGGRSSRWCLTDFRATPQEIPKLTDLVLPKGALLDEFGQSALHSWPGKSKTRGEVTARLKKQAAGRSFAEIPCLRSLNTAGRRQQPVRGHRVLSHASRRTDDGGSSIRKGTAFWSTGMDCVQGGY